MDKNRSLKAPSTMIKLSTCTGLPKFRILGHINNNTNDTTIINSFQTKANKSIQCSSTTSIIPPRSYTPALLQRPTSSQTSINNVTSRIPNKSCGLAKPTPVRQIVSAVSTSSPNKSNINHLKSSTTTKPSILTPTPSSKLASPASNSTIIKKTKALTFNSPSHNLAQQKQYQSQRNNSNSHVNTSTSTTTITTTSAIANQLDLSNLTGDVGQIRRLLEDLLKIINSSNESDKFDNNNNLLVEYERLKKENLELKETISAMNKQSRLTGNSSVYYSPQT